jgi:hypothetical protein
MAGRRLERQISSSCEWGYKGRDSPMFGFSVDRLTASNPRRVGQDFTRAGTPFDRWVQGERRLSASGFQGVAIHPLIHGSVQVEREISKPCEC